MTSVLQKIFDLSKPALPPSPWTFLTPVSSLRQLPDAESLRRAVTQNLATRGRVHQSTASGKGAGSCVPAQSIDMVA
jgi:hypothetical protein